ncbi:MAG: tRNA 2-thiouridine(34) synthase MnmA, partial [Planctomycetota bacterium]|nr:tRNA 2-thiouridine(34) synthase MnmA [Planctomycetota bacterium]
RRIAQEQALPTSINRSSRDICFAQEGYRALFAGSSVPPGDIVDVEGRKIGEHNGIFNYTIGQKKGLGTARQMSGGGEPLYVLRIEPKENRIVVAPLNLLYKKEIQVEKINYVGFEPPDKPLLVQTRIRYRQPDESATLIPVSEDGAIVIFDRPVFAPTAGQFAVFFCGRLLLGGGVIKG